MYSKLIYALKGEPAVYESTGIAFWDDAHISRSMLEAHLAPDGEGASRRHDFIERSARWIGSLPAPGKTLLDLGCGPGLYAEAFARMGFQVTGLDFSRRSIEYAMESAEQKGLDIAYRYQDYLLLDERERFDMAVLIYCDFGVLPPGDRKTLLEKVYGALKPGGLFILDGWSIHQYASFADGIRTSYEEKGFWREKPYALMQKDKRYEGDNFLEQYIVVTEGDCVTYNLWNHGFTADELAKDFREAGFGGLECYGDVSGKAAGEDDVTICIVGRK